MAIRKVCDELEPRFSRCQRDAKAILWEKVVTIDSAERVYG